MELDASFLAIIVFLVVLIVLLWDWSSDWKDTFDDFWEELDWKREIEDDEPETKRTKSGKK